MRDGWERVELGELIEKRSDFTPIDPDTEYVILGVKRSGWGFVQRDPIFGRDQKFTKLMRLEEDDLVYRTITAFEAPSAVAGPAEAGLYVTPQTFPVFRINTQRLLPAYMRLLTTWPDFHDAMAARCTGTVLRRKTLAVKAFRTIPIDLPPAAEQQRIVGVVASIDHAETKVRRLRHASGLLLAARLETALGHLGGENVPLEDVFAHVLGGSWGNAPGVDEVEVVALGPTAYANGATDVDPLVGSARSLSKKRAADRELRRGDIVLERSGGSPTQPVGRVIRMRVDQPNVVPSDFMRLLRVDPEKADSDFIFWAMRSKYLSGAALPYQKFTTGLRNLNIPNYLSATSVPLPDRATQREYVDVAESLSESTSKLDTYEQALRVLRSNLLAALLSGEHEIPESYDELLEEALP